MAATLAETAAAAATSEGVAVAAEGVATLAVTATLAAAAGRESGGAARACRGGTSATPPAGGPAGGLAAAAAGGGGGGGMMGGILIGTRCCRSGGRSRKTRKVCHTHTHTHTHTPHTRSPVCPPALLNYILAMTLEFFLNQMIGFRVWMAGGAGDQGAIAGYRRPTGECWTNPGLECGRFFVWQR